MWIRFNHADQTTIGSKPGERITLTRRPIPNKNGLSNDSSKIRTWWFHLGLSTTLDLTVEKLRKNQSKESDRSKLKWAGPMSATPTYITREGGRKKNVFDIV